jgi:hypothetical protein
LIFATSITYPDDVRQHVERLEKQKLGQQVVLAKQWYVPTYKYEVLVEIRKLRPLNIIEEFIVKIALSGFKEVVDQAFVSGLLGLDGVFVDTYTANLANNAIIDRDQLPAISITERGMEYINKGLIPVDLKNETLEVYFDPLFKSFYHRGTSSGTKKLQILEEAKKAVFSDFGLRKEVENHISKQLISHLAKKKGLILESTSLGQQIADISLVSEQHVGRGYASFIEIWVYDIIEDTFFCRVWDEINETYREDIENYVTKKNPPNKNDIEVSEDFLRILPQTGTTTKYENIIRENLAILRNSKSPSIVSNDGTVRLLRGPEIRAEFSNVFSKVERILTVFSPWITEETVDANMVEKFKELAKKGICAFIGWGISKKEQSEGKKPSNELIKTLNGIKDTNGLPAVFISWLGNRHEKEIVVDHSIHLMGSFNWLSYRGDYLPRGESVYLVTHKEMVEEAANHWQEAFTECYQRRIQKTKQTPDYQFIRDLCALLCLGGGNVNAILDDLLDDLLQNQKNQTVLNVLLLLFHKKKFDHAFDRCFEFLLRNGGFLQVINSILHRCYRVERAVFERIVGDHDKILRSLKVINNKGKLISKTEIPLKITLTE